jgi:hypothetical protein
MHPRIKKEGAMAMLPDLQSTLLCDDVRQERTGKFILIGLFDSLGSPTVPVPASADVPGDALVFGRGGVRAAHESCGRT